MKILIKGAGDLATGIAYMFHQKGFRILMTEIAVPLTVRRMAAMSRAVYEGEAVVEDMRGILVHHMEEAQVVMEHGDVAVIVDEVAQIRFQYCPDVLIDAVLAKKNLGTYIGDAPFVIGAGPGFAAGVDCHCVIETKRGETLGQVIWEGGALPNTGIPGEVAGYSIERLIKAEAEGIIEPIRTIGEMVDKGEIAAYTGGQPVFAGMSGIIRGMLQKGVYVSKGLKIGDIDARREQGLCFQISDKAKKVGSGALYAVTQHRIGKPYIQKEKGDVYAILLLAAGISRRFQGKKLLTEAGGKLMYLHMLELAGSFPAFPCVIVTGEEEILCEAKRRGMAAVKNMEPELGISHSVRLGVRECVRIDSNPEAAGSLRGILIAVCDQPGLMADTVGRLFRTAKEHPGQIVCAAYQGQCRNPVLFDRKYIPELLSITGDTGGRQLLGLHPGEVVCVEAEEFELTDVDTRKDLFTIYKK